MRIAIDLSGIDEHTGVRVYAHQLLRELQRADTNHEFFVIARRRDIDIYPVDGRVVKPIFMPSMAEGAVANIAWHWSGFLATLRRWRIDLVHQLDCNRIFPPFGRALVVTVHGLIDPRIPGRRHFFRQRYNSIVVPRLLCLATQIISVSNNTRRDLLHYTKIPGNKITVIQEGCALKDSEFSSKAAARKLLDVCYGLRDGFILYVARLEHPNKNHIALLKAYDLLRRTGVSLPHLVFVGADSYRADIVRQQAKTLSLTESVTMTGFVPDNHLPAFYQCAATYICPTLYEGFGLPLLEAMQFGVPIVCSNSSSLPEVVGAAAVKINPNSVSSIATGLRAVLSDPSLRQSLVDAGYAQLKRFSTVEMAKKTLELYSQTRPLSQIESNTQQQSYSRLNRKCPTKRADCAK